MRRIPVLRYAPILVMVIVVALVNVGGVALSLDRGNRGETAPTPVDVTKVRVAKRFIPAGTPVEHLSKLLTTWTSIPTAELRQPTRQLGWVLRDSTPHAPRHGRRLSGYLTTVDIYPGQQFMEHSCISCVSTVLR